MHPAKLAGQLRYAVLGPAMSLFSGREGKQSSRLLCGQHARLVLGCAGWRAALVAQVIAHRPHEAQARMAGPELPAYLEAGPPIDRLVMRDQPVARYLRTLCLSPSPTVGLRINDAGGHTHQGRNLLQMRGQQIALPLQGHSGPPLS